MTKNKQMYVYKNDKINQTNGHIKLAWIEESH